MGSKCCKCHSDKTDNIYISSAVSNSTVTSSNYYLHSFRGNRQLIFERYKPYELRRNSSSLRRKKSIRFYDSGCEFSADSSPSSPRQSDDDSLQTNSNYKRPLFKHQLRDQTVRVGSNVRFIVEIGSDLPLQVNWYKDSQLLRQNEKYLFVQRAQIYCLQINGVVLHDEGNWLCVAENTYGHTLSAAYLNVFVPKLYKAPHFTEELKATVGENGSVFLQCKVSGIPAPDLFWYKDGKRIKAGDVFALKADFSHAQCFGTYSCVAKNCLGQAFSSSVIRLSEHEITSDSSKN